MESFNKTSQPSITVCIPMYNAACYLRECIDSILAQTFTDFELLIVDDGSVDDSCEIVCSYDDPRIRLIKNKHDYIGSLNMLLDEAKGKYIARMDADDIMPEDRLAFQYEYMEKHTEVDLLGGGMQFYRDGKAEGNCFPYYDDFITIYRMLDGCCIGHPTILAKKSIFEQYGFRYEQKYIYAEDYRLWMEMLKAGIRMRNVNKLMLYYRMSGSQVGSRHSKEQFRRAEEIREDVRTWLMVKEQDILHEKVSIPHSDNQLTVVIPFLNEGDEVANTVRSIRETVGDQVDIIIINDHSDDGYPYEKDLERFHVYYVYNSFRLGAALSKERGAQLCTTPYFLLLDAHMRFYDSNWASRIIEGLQENDNRLLCCQSKPLKKEKGIVVEGEDMDTYGAYLLFEHQEYIPGIRWNSHRIVRSLHEGQIPCVLGAVYAASKRYWNYIKGLEGLIHYGSEEAYISIKAWLEGGGCSFLPDVTIGHIYRGAFPYSVNSALMAYNYLLIVETLFPTSLKCLAKAVVWRKNKEVYKTVCQWLKTRKEVNDALRTYYHKLQRNDFPFILRINELLTPKEEELAWKEGQRLPEIMNFCLNKSKIIENIGLINGLMGYVILFCSYASYSGDESYDDEASRLFERICNLLDNENPVTLNKGICGIGWGILYLLSHGLLEEDMEDELVKIDKLVMERNISRMSDYSMMSGIGGIMVYVVTRIGLSKRSGQGYPAFTTEYLDELKEKALHLLQQDKEIDYRTFSLALQVEEMDEKCWNILSPQWEELLDFPTILPNDPKYWKEGMHEVSGYAMQLMKRLTQIQPN